jgi:2-amino-4-hydroxy-6-hydroxymethyldihydropteridine diphosphokinase
VAETTVYLSLGSNLGDREKNLRTAIAAFADAKVRVKRVSSFYETEPVDLREQPWFLNCAVQAETELPPLDLLRALRGIESRMGSKKLVPKGPRLIDLDILLYGDETVETPELQVPHPRMLQRKFVLVPLAEIAPNLKHPSWKETASHLLANIGDSNLVRKLAEAP